MPNSIYFYHPTVSHCTRITPWRIVHSPGIVLEVVTGSDTQSRSTSEIVGVVNIKSEAAELVGQDNKLYSQPCTEISVDTSSITCNTVTPTIGRMDTNGQALVKYSEGLSDRSQPSLSSNPAIDACLQTITSEQRLQAADIKQSLDRGFDQLVQQHKQSREELLGKLQKMEQSLEQKQQEMFELQRNLEDKQELILQLQESTKNELLNKQEEIQGLQQCAKDELLRKQEEMLDMQRQTLNRLAVILSHVKALLTQTYELHEYPIPRLFIVLPKAMEFRDRFTNTDQYRLYFLCECGTHTMHEGSKVPHEVHLAKHEGYDLEKPKEFFEKYGPYINAMLCMVKYGIIAGGIVIPPLANLKIPDLLELAGKHMDDLRQNIIPLVNDTLSLLQELRDNVPMGGLCTENRGLDKLEALEGVDLRQLESYLKVKDQGRILGNLYRIVTTEGHVKWVCLDHYRASYRESTMKELQDAVESHGGTFIEEAGRIEIEIETSLLARQFYEAMVKARRTYELQIKLKWDATMDDIRALCDAITKANVIRLTVDGTHFKGPTIDIVNRGRRFDPIWKLASNARLQSLQLICFDDFFSRVTKYTLPAPKLRLFSMEWKTLLDDKAIKLFNGFLGHCSGLTALELKVHQQYPTTRDLMDTFPKVQKLEYMKVDHGRLSLVTKFLHDKIQETMVLDRVDGLTYRDSRFIQQHLHKDMMIEYAQKDEDRLMGILRQNSGLVYIQTRRHGEHRHFITPTTDAPLQDLMNLVTSETPSTLESLSIHCQRLTLKAGFSEGKTQDMTMTIERLVRLNSDDLRFIQENSITKLTIKNTPYEAHENRLTEILTQCPLLSHLQVGCEWSRSLIIVNLVLSTRASIIAQGGSFSLRTVELMDEGPTPFNVLASRDDNTHIHCRLSFPEDSDSFDMRTWIRLGMDMLSDGAGPVRDIILQYGWSVVFFDGYLEDGNILTTFNKMPKTRTSQLESLMIHSADSLEDGVDTLSKVIHHSPNFKDLGLHVNYRGLEQGLSLLGQHGTILSRLRLYGFATDTFSMVASYFPTRNNLPALDSFELRPYNGTTLPPNLTSWIVAMVSAPSQRPAPSASQHIPQDPVIDEHSTYSASGSARSWTPLRKVMLRGVQLQRDEWKRVIESLGVSALEHLDLSESNIVQHPFEMLVDLIIDNSASNLTVKTLDIRESNLAKTTNSGSLDNIIARLRKKAPLVKIILGP